MTTADRPAGKDRSDPRPRSPERSSEPLAAVLFDMDGVVTDTADAHAAAWKRLFDEYLHSRAERCGEDHAPFDIQRDYRRHVDGKPRYDGVASFLEARGIALPQGDPSDSPDRETICGLGNRKNRYFTQWLAEHRVDRFPATLAFIEQLRRAGLGVAVFSSSRNCEEVLRNAGVEHLFDARVDGNDLARLDLPGKPDPAILIEAGNRLGVEPGRTAVIEDSVAGVRAAATGGFRTVVGIARDGGREGARDGHREALLAAGADIVVADVGELARDASGSLGARHPADLPSALACMGEVWREIGDRTPAVFLDYDGTLTPIVEDPAAADLAASMRSALAGLAERWPVAVISGRDLADLRERVGLENLTYAGSHGFRIQGPGFDQTAESAEAFLPALDAAEQRLRKRLADIDGHQVERKRFAIAVHYRRVASTDVERLEQILDEVLADRPELRKRHGKKVFQVQPRLDWDKGRAVTWLLERLGLDGRDHVPVYIGDDLTDEDAFRAITGRGIAIVVGDRDRTTSADYALGHPDDVECFMEALARKEQREP